MFKNNNMYNYVFIFSFILKIFQIKYTFVTFFLTEEKERLEQEQKEAEKRGFYLLFIF